ncbi:MAG: hypothetical protein ACRD4F_06025, partial [Candidatus Angelobacter sp.]
MSRTNKVIPRLGITLALMACMAFSTVGYAQQQQPAPSPSPQQSPQNQTSPPDAGGPSGDIGPIAIPKKSPEEPRKEEAPKPPKPVQGMPNYSLRINVPLVTLDVGVL